MRIAKINVYQYEELSDEAKKVALSEVKKDIMEDFDHDWIVDDCYLLNPKGVQELIIENTRKVYYDTTLGYLDISDGMLIKNDQKFFDWLGIDETYRAFIDGYSIHKSTITFHADWELIDESFGCNYTNRQENYNYKKLESNIHEAIAKFKEHCEYILQNICKAYDYYHSDEYAVESLTINDMEFLVNGKLYDLKYVVEELPMQIEE